MHGTGMQFDVNSIYMIGFLHVFFVFFCVLQRDELMNYDHLRSFKVMCEENSAECRMVVGSRENMLRLARTSTGQKAAHGRRHADISRSTMDKQY